MRICLQKLALCTDSEVVFVEFMQAHPLCSKRLTVEICSAHRVAKEGERNKMGKWAFLLTEAPGGTMPFLNGTVLGRDRRTSDRALDVKQSKSAF